MHLSKNLHSEFRNTPLTEVYRLYLHRDKFLVLSKHAGRITSLFRDTYICKNLVLKANILKKNYIEMLLTMIDQTDRRLRIACTQTFQVITILVIKKLCQFSH